MTSDSIQIIWQGEQSTTCGILMYHVRLVVAANEELIQQDTTLNNNYEFSGLSPSIFYIASVYGSNQAGNGDPASMRIQILSSNNNDDNNNNNGMF